VTRRRVIVVVGACVVAGILAVTLWPGDREPSYQGKKLSEWLEMYSGAMHAGFEKSPGRLEAEDAVRHIGTNAIPLLLEWVRYEPPAWRDQVWRKMRLGRRLETDFVARHVLGKEFFHSELAQYGFAILGPEAECAVPELTKLVCYGASPNIAGKAAFALGSMGLPGVLPLVSVATNRGLFLSTRLTALEAVGLAFSADLRPLDPSKASVPALLSMLRDADYGLRLAATNALLRIAPEILASNVLNEGSSSFDYRLSIGEPKRRGPENGVKYKLY